VKVLFSVNDESPDQKLDQTGAIFISSQFLELDRELKLCSLDGC